MHCTISVNYNVGLTETCAGSFVSIPNEMSMLGTVGPPVPNLDARLESIPEMNYDALSSTPQGEICIRGDTLFSGYYKRDDLTKEVLIDGWFHTGLLILARFMLFSYFVKTMYLFILYDVSGDIGEWQPNGSMKVIDRKKNIFKLAQGEYVAVENLENIYVLVPAVDEVCTFQEISFS